ncbi:thiosulfate oxidation carrier protein SoxY [Achromobacter sp. F4_2707]|uniref:thiosulfate oxidation carrier protein SoxY n=1 Tax=Achromobacter sp. F4_2707 TaxID=3114286 RepID=UPI0039C6A093
MIFSKTQKESTEQPLAQRRQLLEGAALSLGLGLLPSAVRAQLASPVPLKPASAAEVQAVISDFLQSAEPLEEGLELEMPVLGDNPAAVPVKARVTLPITPDSYCEELIILAEGNPRPLACRFAFTPLAGTAEVAIRLRLIESQTIRTLARMNDGRVLMAHRHITVTAGGCGM